MARIGGIGMREIKFRAYIKILKWIVPVARINFDCKTVEVDLTDGNGDIAEYGFDEIILMQYTGLKDKNGVEIYEGDVIKTTLGGSVLAVKIGECFPEPVKKYCLHYGIKKHTVYCLHAYDKQGEYLFEDNRAFEVIGNIYDNPELAEVSK
jgi:uncharacterized phage protein (TIGR01671 family)